MSALNLDEKALVAIVSGTIAMTAALHWFSPSKTEGAEPARTFRIASTQVVEEPRYAITYTFARVSPECRVEVIAARDQARCEIEFSRKPVVETVRLKAPRTSYAELR